MPDTTSNQYTAQENAFKIESPPMKRKKKKIKKHVKFSKRK